MEDKTIKKLNIPAADLPEVPRKEDGTIDLEAITIEIDEKNNKIIPDDIFDNYYRELPNGVINNSKTWRTSNSLSKVSRKPFLKRAKNMTNSAQKSTSSLKTLPA